MIRDLRDESFWTAADESELSVLAWEVVRAANLHRDQCGICSRGGPWCEAMTKVVELVLEWREGRILKSKASWLRSRQQAREDLGAAA